MGVNVKSQEQLQHFALRLVQEEASLACHGEGAKVKATEDRASDILKDRKDFTSAIPLLCSFPIDFWHGRQ